MNKSVEISNIPAVRTLVSIAEKKGVSDVVLSPGSRNAPFILSFTALDNFHCQSVLDERTAGFVALGIAQQKRVPVIISCTSGSAVLNYAPALVEAYYQRIPLIAITSDRPASRIDQGEGQSMRQVGVFDNYLVKSVNLIEERKSEDRWLNQRLVNEAIENAFLHNRPVQINIPLSEPLYEISPFDAGESKTLSIFKANQVLSNAHWTILNSQWQKAQRIIILVTQGKEGEECIESLKRLNEDPRVAILTESTSNLYHLGFVACIDRTIDGFLLTDREQDYVPELLITIGDNIISKKLKGFLRRNKTGINNHWHFGDQVLDTFESLTHLLDVKPNYVLNELASQDTQQTDRFGVRWKTQFFKCEELHLQFLRSCPWSDFKAFELIMDFIPDSAVLQMGNSSVVRYIQLYNMVRGLRYFGNRGVSGIEGCTSTAVGAAQAGNKLTVLISGDQAFRYDSNALSVKDGTQNLRVIVINNGGGNIFKIIDGPSNDQVAEEFIERKDLSSVKGLVDYHETEYLRADDVKSLENALIDLFDPKRDRRTVLEVFTPREASPKVLMNYWKFLKQPH